MRRKPLSYRGALNGVLLLWMLAAVSCARPPVPQDLLSQYVTAKEAYLRGDLAGAESGLTSVLSRRKDFHQAAFLLGKVYYFQERLPEAEWTFLRLLSRNPRFNEAELWLVRIALQRGEREKARGKLEELLSYDPNDPRLLYLLGTLFQEKGDVKEALELYQRASAFGEELAKVHLESARLYYQFNLPDKALRELGTCASLISETSLLREPVARLITIISKEAGKK